MAQTMQAMHSHQIKSSHQNANKFLLCHSCRAHRATQTLLDPKTKALLTLRANLERREREARIRESMRSCEERRRESCEASSFICEA